MSDNTVRIATRESPLALWQANTVRQQLKANNPGLVVELVPMTTKGDQIQHVALAKVGGKGLFIKELERALLDGRADMAVHSMKDVTHDMPDGLSISTVLKREDPQDALISSRYTDFDSLPDDALVGTCSPRRQAQLRALKPNLRIKDMRGNVGTRLAKLDSGDFDATLLACAGLMRLGLESRITQRIDTKICLPAAGQGIIGIQLRSSDQRLLNILAPLHHQQSAICLEAERAVTAGLEGGCSAPIAALAQLDGDKLTMVARVIGLDGKTLLETTQSGNGTDAHNIGTAAAKELIKQGAKQLLEEAELFHADAAKTL
ncbi:MAG: hydroxymethylbilane synthase [Granulosicoccaceae bacterium]